MALVLLLLNLNLRTKFILLKGKILMTGLILFLAITAISGTVQKNKNPEYILSWCGKSGEIHLNRRTLDSLLNCSTNLSLISKEHGISIVEFSITTVPKGENTDIVCNTGNAGNTFPKWLIQKIKTLPRGEVLWFNVYKLETAQHKVFKVALSLVVYLD